MNTAKVRADFDEIARLADRGASGSNRYDAFLLSHVPADAIRILDVGCGLGRLTTALATGDRTVLGVDLSPVMIERARRDTGPSPRVSLLCGDFLEMDFGTRAFDCIVSAATLHHMPTEDAVRRMVALLRPGGRLVIQDLRRDTSIVDTMLAGAVLARVALDRFVRTGRLLPPWRVRKAWARHGAGETYPSIEEARAMAERLLPGARVFDHRMWRYTIAWDKPRASAS